MKRRSLALLLVAVPLVGGLGWLFHEAGQGSAMVEREIALAHAQGLPVEPEALRERVERLGGTNGSDAYVRAFRHVQGPVHSSAKDLAAALRALLKGKCTNSDLMKAKATAARYESTMRVLDGASRADRLDHHRQFERGYDLLMPDLIHHRTHAAAVAMDAWLRFERGDREGAERRFVTAARMARHLGDDPTVVSLSVRSRMEYEIALTALKLVTDHPHDRGTKRIVRATLEAFGPPLDLRWAVMGEVTFARQLETLRSASGSGDFWRDVGLKKSYEAPGMRLLRLTPIRRLNEACMLRFWRTLYQGLPEDPTDETGLPAATKAAHAAIKDIPDAGKIVMSWAWTGYDPSPQIFRSLAARRVLAAVLGSPKGRAARDPYTGGPLVTESGGKRHIRALAPAEIAPLDIELPRD